MLDWDTNIFRIGLLADSIWYPTGAVVETDGSHPYAGLKLNTFGRMLYDYLDYNKPTWRSIEHEDWTFVGGSEQAIVFPSLVGTDKIILIGAGESASIQVTGHTTFVLWLEGGYSGKAIDTGTVKVTVNDGSGFKDPSATTLLGRRTPIRSGQTVVYEDIIDTLDTNITYPKYAYNYPASSGYTSHLEIQYNNLDPAKTYTFKVEASAGSIRLGGCFYFTGKTSVVQTISVPGRSWDGLRAVIYNRITINDFQLVLCNSLIYHDFYSIAEITNYTKKFLWQILRKANAPKVILVTCTPGGVVIEDSVPALGDELGAYSEGQNFMREFNHRACYTISQPTYANYPPRGAVYSVNIGGTDYNLTCVLNKVGEVNYAAWTYRTAFVSEYTTGCPIADLSLPATATKVSGDGAATLTLTAVRNFPPSFDTHVALMKSIAKHFGIECIDMYKYFADLAIAAGETVETDGYEIVDGSPLFAAYAGHQENYLSRFFRPNHWDASANEHAFDSIKGSVEIE